MAGFNNFNTWADLADYITNTRGISYTDNPTSWVSAMEELMEGYKFVHIVDEVTGEVTEQIWPEDMVSGVGEIHTVPGNGQSWATGGTGSASTVSGGGAKSVPTAKSIVTNSSGGGTAVITDQAIGVKNNGLITATKGINVLGGLLQVYGLVCTGIKIANAQVWKDMSNYVFDSDFTEDTPIERVIDFLGTKIVNCITDITSDGDLVTNIPDSIATKMYNFLSNHMVQELVPSVDIDEGVFNNIDTFYNFIHRTWSLSNPDQNLDRYFSTTNPSTQYLFPLVDISDDLLRAMITDFSEQIIGSGFSLATGVATALIASMAGIIAFLQEQSVGASEDANYAEVICILNRGATPPPKSTPISLSEFTISVDLKEIPDLNTETIENVDYLKTDFNVDPSFVPQPSLSSGMYDYGDNVKYLKRGHDGTSSTDYAYRVKSDRRSGGGYQTWHTTITYPSNEQVKSYYDATRTSTVLYPAINGYNWSYGTAIYQDGDTYDGGVPDQGTAISYSNLGYKGFGSSYQPDDYLVTAGFRSKTDSSGNPEKHPDPTKTKEQVYSTMTEKKQQANPQAVTDPETGDTSVTNGSTNFVPTSVPFGSNSATQIIEHGVNNPTDPSSYTDNRPQEDKESGKVNQNDPTDGYNEDTDEAIDKYNKSKHDGQHYPDPIPNEEPNPQYPTNPPSEPTGDSGENPTPSAVPGVTASGMVSVYNPTKQQIIDFSAWLWSPNFFDNFIKLLQNPLDAIIGLHIMYATPVTGSPEHIVVGYLDSGVSAKVVTQQYIEISCGSVVVPEYYGTVLDYEPYTSIHIYLPFVGIQTLKANDVIGKTVTVKYGIDTLTGACLATITTTKGTSSIQCYTFPGNCSVQIPLTGGNYAQVIRSIASVAVGVAGSIATANPLPAIGGVVAGAMGSSLDVSHSGSLGSNVGVMGIRKPYIIVTRRVAYDAENYNQFYGYPANKTVVLGTCSGFTRAKSVHIDTIGRATDTEKSEIETLLKQGVIIK